MRSGTARICIWWTTVLVSFLFIATIQISGGASNRMGRSVLINEVLYDPTGSDVGGEFVEILNTGSQPVDIGGWQLTDSDGTGSDIIFPSLVLPSNGYLIVMTGEGQDDTDAADGLATLFMGRGQGVWTNTGDDVLLLMGDGTPVDYLAYGTGTYVDPPPQGVDWNGTLELVPEGFSISRVPDGQDTDDATDLAKSKATPGSPNAIDDHPLISETGVEPGTPEAFEDVLVWAKVSDDVGLDRVWLNISEGEWTVTELDMNLRGDRYEATILGRPGGTILSLEIVAMDLGGKTIMSDNIQLSFRINVSVTLVLELDIPSGPAQPGGQITIDGEAKWSDGTSANGTILVEVLDTMGTWTSNFTRYISQTIECQDLEGEYEIRVTIMSNGTMVIEEGTLLVRWPHESVKVTLELPYKAQEGGPGLLTKERFTVLGKVVFANGIPASDAQAKATIVGTAIFVNGTTAGNGSYQLSMIAPSISGSYSIKVMVAALGRMAEVTKDIEIRDELRLVIDERPQLMVEMDGNITVKGQVDHHDGTPATNSLVVLEIIDTDLKARVFTDNEGGFETFVPAPTLPDEYDVRITAVNGNSTVSATYVSTVKKEAREETPGWTMAYGLLAISLTLVIASRRRSFP